MSWNCYLCEKYLGYHLDRRIIDNQIYCVECGSKVKFIRLKNNPANLMVTELQDQNKNLIKLVNQSNDINHLKNKIKKMESVNKKLNDRITQLENKLNEMVYYAPDGEGYKEAKEDFDKLKEQV